MASLNKVMLIGNVGASPDVRRTTRGSAVANISVATSQQWLDERSGENRKRTEWHRVVVWGRQAEFAQEHLIKGSSVYIEGSLQTREWTDGNGSKRTTTEVRAQRIQVLRGRPGEPGQPPAVAEEESRVGGPVPVAALHAADAADS